MAILLIIILRKQIMRSDMSEKQKTHDENTDSGDSTRKVNDTKKNPAPVEEKISSEALNQLLSASSDIVFGRFNINGQKRFAITTVFVDGMVDSKTVDDDILKPLIQESIIGKTRNEQEIIDQITGGSIYHNRRMFRDKLSDCVTDVLAGSVALVFDQSGLAVTFEVKGFEKRGIVEPTNENVLKGAKESFIEVMRVNTALVRRRIQTSTLLIQEMRLGKRSATSVSVIYISDIANPDTVNQVKQRLSKIPFDSITTVGQLEILLMDNKKTFVPQIVYTERVDKLCAGILEGRVGIMADGLPLALIVPVDINAFLQAPEDYALNYVSSTSFRLLRHLCAFVSLVLPSFYVSVTTFHQEMIPTKLAIAIISSKQGVPFPTYLEVILMLLAFEVLIEAGLRLPQAIAQAVSIVGALVVGQAAIAANILSPGIVIIIAVAGMAGFVVTSQDLSNVLRLLRMLLVLLSIVGGLFTVTAGLIVILYMMCSLEVFGTPYLSPLAGSEGRGMFDDTVFRRAWNKKTYRPSNIKPENIKRQRKTRDSGLGDGG